GDPDDAALAVTIVPRAVLATSTAILGVHRHEDHRVRPDGRLAPPTTSEKDRVCLAARPPKLLRASPECPLEQEPADEGLGELPNDPLATRPGVPQEPGDVLRAEQSGRVAIDRRRAHSSPSSSPSPSSSWPSSV